MTTSPAVGSIAGLIFGWLIVSLYKQICSSLDAKVDKHFVMAFMVATPLSGLVVGLKIDKLALSEALITCAIVVTVVTITAYKLLKKIFK